MVTSGGIENDIRATSNINEAPHLSTDHEVLTLGWNYMREMQQQWGITEMLANLLTQIRVSDVFIL